VHNLSLFKSEYIDTSFKLSCHSRPHDMIHRFSIWIWKVPVTNLISFYSKRQLWIQGKYWFRKIVFSFYIFHKSLLSGLEDSILFFLVFLGLRQETRYQYMWPKETLCTFNIRKCKVAMFSKYIDFAYIE
jgi:hypothetical protein